MSPLGGVRCIAWSAETHTAHREIKALGFVLRCPTSIREGPYFRNIILIIIVIQYVLESE